jgi:hypothetical protein
MGKFTSKGAHTRKIILQSILVSVPMLASSTTVLYIVYANIVNGSCPEDVLCSSVDNGTYNGHYLIDFPAARLAFISSGSATVSFALLGVLMSMYTYINAASFIRTYEKNTDSPLQTPNQTIVVLKVLNAEMTVLWELAFSKIKRVFWHREADDDTSYQSPGLVKRCTAALVAGIVARYVWQYLKQ